MLVDLLRADRFFLRGELEFRGGDIVEIELLGFRVAVFLCKDSDTSPSGCMSL